ncbi:MULTISPECIES: bifunctional methylenetetrahydrofolate dehydrogenase/methenyltetrahydrofolate cyclohydrolase FolD [unclassified Lentimicrobium]|uniref:bifunctional methylenetetrahydrofolate dehydrogenase/methenyltetrahydrofolate cyclohydrolase FolD n=1 Tax=unclassified Lentimicrobium TaxID=2677434 RepID=UPI00155574CA|nr:MULTISPECIES: bifunctional methylenetetrahydrofolate dehydrogenase/methenyltetrahydrofolate cyclohydrolase FolD [unclassified Lentimicrobium]NPD44411.1 bifunctional methylenetetrahydrofolate dehydrogenase/methenyltetrahydrofolate cyclohydrolase FolD [Lentimicrobium sp. S6]NPD84323.1 bifunctional methylenetetrahydrofolate dehydrogenase/methenyltetrahydrofolate cyclohydrolase FolD [Lentimicrobium sp. L6]
MSKLIDGKVTSKKIKDKIAAQVAKMIDNDEKAPHLAAVLVGADPASEFYVKSKEKACRSVGITSSLYKYSEKTTEAELIEIIDFLNNDPDVDGFIVQLPLPDHIDVDRVINKIDPSKDVDGFHPINIGKMVTGAPTYLPATPYGIMMMIEEYKIETSGKNVVVLGRSNIVGTPISIMLSRKSNPGDATVTLCHSRTKNLKEITAQADIIIAAIGQPEFLTEDMVKKDAVIIDVGIHRKNDNSEKGYKIVGDVKFDEVSKKASLITPVPGGVGLMTIAALLENTLKASKKEVYR